MKNYTQDYIDACRPRIPTALAAYRCLDEANSKSDVARDGRRNCASETFETTFFNNMVLLLDYLFVHRLRMVDGKDGNPLNEVRILCNSMLHNNSILTEDTQIKLSPTRSVLKCQFGEAIKLNEADFLLLYKAFFAEIESKYL